ncbi:MAG: ATP-binding cassette domain-containing protein [Pseudomonadota bacterium]|nr:ATP-binding cassette domain-containing protein [Pseudomonadota bacterium]
MAPPLLMLREIALTFGGKPLLTGADLVVGPGERVSLVGRNGSGKSTLLKIAAGLVERDDGEIFRQPGTTVRYLPQEPDFGGHPTVRAFVEAGLAPGDDPWRATWLLDSLGLTGNEHPATLSGGEARRAALARVLAPQPDILLLDEPTNHLDLPAIEWLEQELLSMRSALVLISHDRRFLETLTGVTVWLDRGRTRRLDRGFGAFEEWRDSVLEAEEQELHRLDRRIASETEWLHKGVTARRKRNMGRLRALHGLRAERRGFERAQGNVTMAAAEADRSGKLVVECAKVTRGYGGPPVVRDLDLRLLRGDRMAIVGPNGAGKTTLLRLLTGELEPDSGTVRIGTALERASLDQRRESLDPDWSLSDALTGGGGDTVFVNGAPRHVVSYMKDFLFDPRQLRTPIGALSGGERGRLMLARALARPSNLLVLDEPTNDLDMETLDLLQDLLGDYGGTVLLVSHDRDFIDRVATSVLLSEGEGRWVPYAGGWSDMLAQRGGSPFASPQATEAARAQPRKETPATPKPAPAATRKLSFKQKHALETLPKTMTALEDEVARLKDELADGSLFRRDPKRFTAASTRLAQAEEAYAAAEEEWLELEILREEIEAERQAG